MGMLTTQAAGQSAIWCRSRESFQQLAYVISKCFRSVLCFIRTCFKVTTFPKNSKSCNCLKPCMCFVFTIRKIRWQNQWLAIGWDEWLKPTRFAHVHGPHPTKFAIGRNKIIIGSQYVHVCCTMFSKYYNLWHLIIYIYYIINYVHIVL